MPSLSAEEAPKLRPYMELAEKLGALVGQLEGDEIQGLGVETEGHAAELNQKPITAAVLAGRQRVYSDSFHMVNAPYQIARASRRASVSQYVEITVLPDS